jgi:hypothetical protein
MARKKQGQKATAAVPPDPALEQLLQSLSLQSPPMWSPVGNNSGKLLRNTLVALIALGGSIMIIMFAARFGRSSSMEAAHAQVERQAGATPLLGPDEELLPLFLKTEVGTDWFSPAPEKNIDVWGYPTVRNLNWRVKYTMLDGSETVIEMGSRNKPLKKFVKPTGLVMLIEYSLDPGQAAAHCQWEFYPSPPSV